MENKRNLPSDILSIIIDKAILPVERCLYYKSLKLRFIPKKINISSELEDKLNIICTRRVSQYKTKLELEFKYNGMTSTFLEYFSIPIENYKKIIVSFDSIDPVEKSIMGMSLKVCQNGPGMYDNATIRKIICNVNTGVITSDWMNDSDDDDC